MRSGALRHRVTILKPVIGTGYGSKITYESYKNVWASIEMLRGLERYNAVINVPKTTYTITMRYINGINQSFRIRYNNKHYRIVTINNVGEKNRELILTCELFEDVENV